MDADRRVDRLAILRGNGPQRDEDLGLREDIFVQDRGPLGDQRHADATRSAAARVRVDGASRARAATQPWSAATLCGCEWLHSGRRWPGRAWSALLPRGSGRARRQSGGCARDTLPPPAWAT